MMFLMMWIFVDGLMLDEVDFMTTWSCFDDTMWWWFDVFRSQIWKDLRFIHAFGIWNQLLYFNGERFETTLLVWGNPDGDAVRTNLWQNTCIWDISLFFLTEASVTPEPWRKTGEPLSWFWFCLSRYIYPKDNFVCATWLRSNQQLHLTPARLEGGKVESWSKSSKNPAIQRENTRPSGVARSLLVESRRNMWLMAKLMVACLIWYNLRWGKIWWRSGIGVSIGGGFLCRGCQQ